MVLLVTAVLSLTSCSSGSQPAPVVPPAETHDPSALVLTGDRLAEIRAMATDSELDVLRDGVVEFAEYEALVLSTISCIEDAGATIVNVKSVTGSRTALYDLAETSAGYRLTTRGKILYSATGGTEFDAGLADRVGACKADSAVIEAIWAEHVQPGEVELQEMRKMTAACLRDSGYSAPENPTEDELARIAFPPDGVPAPGERLPEWFEDCELRTAFTFDVG